MISQGTRGQFGRYADYRALQRLRSDLVAFDVRFLGVIRNLESFLLPAHMIEQFAFGGKILRKLNGIVFTFAVK